MCMLCCVIEMGILLQVRSRFAGAANAGESADRAVAAPSDNAQEQWCAEYVRLRLALHELERTDGVEPVQGALAIGLLLPGSDTVTIRQRPALIRSVRGQVSSLEAAHKVDHEVWQPGSEMFEHGRKMLVRSEEKKLCSEIEVRWSCKILQECRAQIRY